MLYSEEETGEKLEIPFIFPSGNIEQIQRLDAKSDSFNQFVKNPTEGTLISAQANESHPHLGVEEQIAVW